MAAAMVQEISESPFDRVSNHLDRICRFLRRCLNARDVPPDVAVSLRGLLGRRFHFRRDHRKPATSVAGARRFAETP